MNAFKPLLLFLGLPLSFFYRALSYLRNKAYDLGQKKVTSVKPTVVSIGNIVAGGTGKTPWTMKVAQDLFPYAPSLAILSRGYRSKFEHLKYPTLICKGEGPLFPPHWCGDEPYMICQNLPEISFYVGKSRTRSAQLAQEAKATLLLLDDGMQHRKLARDFECVLVDGRDLFGKGYFLPSGRLRDSPHQLKRADLVIVNHCGDQAHREEIEKKLRAYTNAPLVYAHFEVKGFFNLKNQSCFIKEGLKCAAFCALGQPKGFYELLEENRFSLVSKKSLRDHQPFTISQLSKWVLAAKQRGALAILCTEKDAVKLPKSLQLELPFYYLKIEPCIVKGLENYENFLNKIKGSIAFKNSISL